MPGLLNRSQHSAEIHCPPVSHHGAGVKVCAARKYLEGRDVRGGVGEGDALGSAVPAYNDPSSFPGRAKHVRSWAVVVRSLARIHSWVIAAVC